MVPPTFVPRTRPHVLELDLEDGVILYDPDPSLVHHLNPSAAEIWWRCDGRRPVTSIETDLAETYGVPIDQMRKEVRPAITRFESLGLVEDVSIEEGPSTSARQRSE
jgi:coenzyme PQQ synthesis protein D (PqqD)